MIISLEDDVATDRFGASRWPERLEFSSAATAAKKLATEQAAALSAEERALGKIKSQLTAFRVK